MTPFKPAHTDRVTDIEARLRAAAFGADLAASDAVLAEGASGEPRTRWFTAVVLGGRGDYARAAALLDPLLACRNAVVASLAASTLGSHRRQLGGHANARVLDAAALRAIAGVLAGDRERGPGPAGPDGTAGRAGADGIVGPADSADPDGIDVAGAFADALLGLAADALALGRQREARTLLSRITASASSSWRTSVRHAWVSAEVELAAGDAAAARPHAERAVALAAEHGGTRHALKSDLVLAAALSADGATDTASRVTALAAQVRDDTRKLGLYPLAWPATLLLADATGTDDAAAASELRQEAINIVHALLQRADPLGSSLASASPWVPKVGGKTR